MAQLKKILAIDGGNLRAIRLLAEEAVATHKPQLDEICALL